ncbi:gluconokinase [Caulobacter sp. NIBR2454]|uniref:gluconokinase n=1 Tax=Caulobacter sp. NIBR2454 TaxID=3015996 RepID=UPI0022B62026|nr:gluconokinase [Caulobacter sp. NIBR2454]
MPPSSPTPDQADIAVIVMGVSGCGKSTLGALLADSLQCPFLEGDAFHDDRAVAKMRAGVPLNDDDRWPWLDRVASAIAEALAARGRVVAACSALRLSYRERLRTQVGSPLRFVLLEAGHDELARRLTARSGHYMPPSLLDSQLATLERPLDEEAVLILDASIPPERLRQMTEAWLMSQAAGTLRA